MRLKFTLIRRFSLARTGGGPHSPRTSHALSMAGLSMTPLWTSNHTGERCRRLIRCGPCWRESRRVGRWAHLLLVRSLLLSSLSRWLLYILIQWKVRPRGSPINSTGAKPGASGTVSGNLPRCGDISHSAVAEKSHSCRGSKSPGPRLACDATCAMEWRWRYEGGPAQARRHHGVRGA